MKHLDLVRYGLLVMMIFLSMTLSAQITVEVTGPTTATVGQTKNYTVIWRNGGSTISPLTTGDFSWFAMGGTTSSGTNASASVLWNSPGPKIVTFEYTTWNNYYTHDLLVTVSDVTPTTPTATFTISKYCGNTVVTRSTAPPTGLTWYWQTSSTGTSTTLGSGTSITRTTAGSLYLRARNSSGTWSTAQSVGSITLVSAPPSVPATANHKDAITNTATPVALSVSTVSGATSYRWYTASSGGSRVAGANTTSYSPSLAATTTYYVASYIDSCGSTTRKAVTATIHPLPVISVSNNGTSTMGDSVTLSLNYSYDQRQWKKNGSDISGATGTTHTTNQAGDYSVTVSKGNSSSAEPTTVKHVSAGIAGLQDMNYIISETILIEGVTDAEAIDGLTVDQNMQTVQYFDGLGRPIQTVVTQGSPDKKDIVQPVVYDAFGREARKYLPVVPNANNGWYKPEIIDANGNYTGVAANFYSNNAGSKIAQDSRPFSETTFEESPLNRPTKSYAPGAAWSDKPVELQYLINTHNTGTTGGEKVIAWSVNSSGMPVREPAYTGFIESGGYYSSGQLFVNATIDEQGNAVREYKNKSGQVVLKKVQAIANSTNLNSTTDWALTYYIYDDFGNLRFVLPPELNKLIHGRADTDPVTDMDINNWAFLYKYDDRNRMKVKKVPGADSVYMVYDKRDRLVLTQDGNQRKDVNGNLTKKEWTFTKYDTLNRPVMTGIYTHTDVVDRKAMASLISKTKFCESFSSSLGASHGYTSNVFPKTGYTVLTVTYYDTYDFKTFSSGLNYVNNDYTSQPTDIPVENLRVLGQVTGTKINILGTTNYLYGVTYYDDKYRAIQSITQNHKSGTDRATNKFDFAGKVLETKRTYLVNAVSRTVKETFTYDHAGRLLTVKHSTNGAADIMIVKNDYNELGQLVDKQLHSKDNEPFKQSVDYRYNIRGWLTKINESDVFEMASGETLGDYFGMELAYNNTFSDVASTPAFNGNISAAKWSTGVVGGSNLQGNAYDYDALNRLKNTNHYKDRYTGWASDDSNLETGFSYDLNGNIQGLTRKGDQAAIIDNLSYNYTGNKLNYVNDTADATKGFVNGNTGTDDYAYDVNGNLIKDKNKGIANNNDIKYNYLNLPTEVVKGSDKIKYVYDATGRKLYQELYTGVTLTKTTDYVGELIFENNALQFINHAEGRVLPDGANWEYQYHLKDHLGNVRLTFTAKTPTATQHTATFETGTQTTEQATFTNYSKVTYDLVDKTDAGTAYNKVQLLNGGASGRVGLGKSYSVMPGDKIKAEVYAKYRNLTGNANATSFITALASAFGTSSAATGELGKLYAGLNSYAGMVAGGDHYDDDEAAPKAFVTIILFDKNYNLVDAAWDQIDVAANQTSGTIKTPPVHDYMNKEVIVSEPGYAYVFLSNEHPKFVDIYYDDVKITHTPSPIVGVNDYYPFGLTFNSYQRENSTTNNYLYNGKEKQDELDLGWLDYGARMYMPEIGRWGSIDPHAEKYVPNTPYNYAFNSPGLIVDPNGKDGVIYIQVLLDKNGNSSIDKKALNKAINTINNALKELGIDLKVEAHYSNKIMSKDEFYSRKGADKTDSYLVLGSNKQLVSVAPEFEKKGWDYRIARTDYSDLNGRHSKDENFGVLNADNLKQNFIGADGRFEDYKGTDDKTAITTMHEDGHSKFKNHPKANRDGHVTGTVMDENPGTGAAYDAWMIRALKSIHGTVEQPKKK